MSQDGIEPDLCLHCVSLFLLALLPEINFYG